MKFNILCLMQIICDVMVRRLHEGWLKAGLVCNVLAVSYFVVILTYKEERWVMGSGRHIRASKKWSQFANTFQIIYVFLNEN